MLPSVYSLLVALGPMGVGALEVQHPPGTPVAEKLWTAWKAWVVLRVSLWDHRRSLKL